VYYKIVMGAGKLDEARDLLAPVYGWFAEGFDTLNLKQAKGLLDELRARDHPFFRGGLQEVCWRPSEGILAYVCSPFSVLSHKASAPVTPSCAASMTFLAMTAVVPS
jgi:hypothetical protein